MSNPAVIRNRLPNRRGSVKFTLQVGGLSFTATVSRFADGSLGEIFLKTKRPTAPPASWRATLPLPHRSRCNSAACSTRCARRSNVMR